MRKLTFVLTWASVLALTVAPCYGASEITLDEVQQVEGVSTGGSVLAEIPVRFIFRLTNTNGHNLTLIYHGFRVWTHRNSVYTDNFTPLIDDTLHIQPNGWLYVPPWVYGFFDMVTSGKFSVDGVGEDTVRFAAFHTKPPGQGGPGIPDGFDEQVYWIETGDLVAGDTICIDSSYFPPHGEWLWEYDFTTQFPPDWFGPYCYEVTSCCIGNRGNVDLQGGVDVADITALVSYLFPPHDSLLCTGAGNVDGLSYAGVPVNVADITYLVAYLFQEGPEPAPCP